MGFGVSKPKGKDINIVGLDELKEKETKEITEINELAISKCDFVLEKNGRFRDNYHIGKTIGHGTYGEVRKGVNKITGAVRACKIIKKEFLKGNEKIRFFYEMEIMKMLDHPNILRIYEIYQDSKRLFLITELCTGGELFEEIVKKKSKSYGPR